MATNTTTTLTDQYQAFLNRKLLSLVIQELRLNQFAQKAELPKNAGGLTVTFFKYDDPASSNVQSLTEGTTPTTTRALSLTTVTATLTQYGELMIGTDILSNTDLFNWLKNGIYIMGQEAALHADDLSREELADNGTKKYAQGAASFVALRDAETAAAKWIANDGIDIATRLKINRGPKIGGAYIAVICPQVSCDVQKDPDWKEVNKYAGGTAIFKGELGMLNGVRYVEATNPHIDDSTGTEGTHTATGDVFSTFYLAGEAFGAVALAGDRPASPRVYVVRGADKEDPLDQQTKAGWKAFFCSKNLNTDWSRVYKSKSSFNG